MQLNKAISVNLTLTKSINLGRDDAASELLENYVLTSTTLRGIQNITEANLSVNANKAWSLIGSYGAGKSSFALYLSHLLGNPATKLSKLAITKLNKENPDIGKVVAKNLKTTKGYCKLLITGAPESLTESFLKALKSSITDYYHKLKITDEKSLATIDKLLASENISLSTIGKLVVEVQTTIKSNGGKGLLIVIDELGKFLEYSARHETDDIFLLQILAEATYNNDILLFVLLHQAFEQYGKNLDTKLKNEWTKIQGRYETLSFAETTTQSLYMMAKVLQNKLTKPQLTPIKAEIKKVVKTLENNGLLPDSLDDKTANTMFASCYPLHPVTALLLPTLCQKVAQNERTLFNYLGGSEQHSLAKTITKLKVGDFIMPADIFDYFLTGQILSNDSQLKRTISEANSAIDRFSANNLAEMNLLKTIGLLNVVGLIPASETLLKVCDNSFAKNIKNLKTQSIVNYRKFNNEYRVWQGSDFDINEELAKLDAQLSILNIPEELNNLETFLPFVAKKYSIEKHSLFYFQPLFINISEYKKHEVKASNPRVIFCLSDTKKDKQIFDKNILQHFSEQDICVLLHNSENIKKVVKNQVAIKEIIKNNPVIQQDPVIDRELKSYLKNAEVASATEINGILEVPKNCKWYNQKQQKNIKTKRDIQRLFSDILENVYNKTPIIKNEIINRNNPSAQANSGRKKLLIALLKNADKEDLGIEGYPAEKSMYRAILKDSGLHKKVDASWGIVPPENDAYLGVWNIVEDFFQNAETKPKSLSSLDSTLTAPPFGVKKTVLPIFYIANYLYNKDEIAIYEDRFYVPYFTTEHLERFLKRPDTFSFQQFKIKGINQSLMQEYENNLLNKKAPNAPAIFTAIHSFIKGLPSYTQKTDNISQTAKAIRDSFKNNKSPQDLLFRKLPEACGFTDKKTAGFGEVLKQSLQEIKNAYTAMINQQIGILAEKLNIERFEKNKGKIKLRLVEYGQQLQAYTIDKETTKFIKAIGEDSNDTDHYFERILMSVNNKHPKEWSDRDNYFSKQKLSESIKLIINLDKIRAYHVKNNLIDIQEQAIITSTEILSDEAKIRVVSKILENISTVKKVKAKNG